MINLKQKELYHWQKENFGISKDDITRCALGMSEETGELCHHILKGLQGIREGVKGLDKAEVADAIADTLIYGIQLMSALNLDAEKEIAKVIGQVLKRNWKDNKIDGSVGDISDNG